MFMVVVGRGVVVGGVKTAFAATEAEESDEEDDDEGC